MYEGLAPRRPLFWKIYLHKDESYTEPDVEN
jgi:hypothetical protein